MTYRRNFFSYFNFLGISFCIFIAWASYFGYKSLVINGLLAFFVFCVLKCVMFAKFKNDDELEFAGSKDFWMEFLSDDMARDL